MAVFSPGNAGITPLYGNIQDALNKRADIASKDTGALGAVNAIAAPIVAEGQRLQEEKSKRELLSFKTALEDQLSQHQTEYTAAANGRMPVTQEIIDKKWKEHNLPPETKPTISGTIFLSDEDMQKHIAVAEQRVNLNALADKLEADDPKRAAAVRALGIPNEKLTPGAAEAIRKISFPEDEEKKKVRSWVDPGTKERVTEDAAGNRTFASGPYAGVPVDQMPSSVSDVKQLTKDEKDTLEKAKSEIKKVTKPYTDTLDKLDTVKKIVEENNPNTLINIKAEDLQTSGVTGGRLNQKYISQEGFNAGLVERGQQMLVQLKGDKALSEGNQAAIIAYLKVKEAEAKDHLRANIADQAASVSLPRVSSEAVNKELSKHANRYLSSESPNPSPQLKVPVKGPNGETGIAFKGQTLPKGWQYVLE